MFWYLKKIIFWHGCWSTTPRYARARGMILDNGKIHELSVFIRSLYVVWLRGSRLLLKLFWLPSRSLSNKLSFESQCHLKFLSSLAYLSSGWSTSMSKGNCFEISKYVFHCFPILLFLQKSFESRLIETFVDARLHQRQHIEFKWMKKDVW